MAAADLLYEGQSFESISDLLDAIRRYGEANRCLLVKNDSRKAKYEASGDVYDYIIFSCKQGGRKRETKSRGIRLNQTTLKCGCPAKVRAVSKLLNSKIIYKLTKVSLDHNHPLSDCDLYPEFRRFDIDEDFKNLVMKGATIGALREYIIIHQQKSPKARDVYNAKRKVILQAKEQARISGQSSKISTIPMRARITPRASHKLNGVDKMTAEHLVEEVSKRPNLYDVGHPEYNNNTAAGIGWTEVGVTLNLSAELCKKTWNKLQRGYMKFKAKQLSETEGIRPTFFLECQMSFLDQYYTVVCTDINPDQLSFELDADFEADEHITKCEPVSENTSITFMPPESCHKMEITETTETTDKLTLSPVVSDQRLHEYTDSDLEFMKGLLPKIKELNKNNKSDFFLSVTTTLFSLLKSQDEPS